MSKKKFKNYFKNNFLDKKTISALDYVDIFLMAKENNLTEKEFEKMFSSFFKKCPFSNIYCNKSINQYCEKDEICSLIS